MLLLLCGCRCLQLVIKCHCFGHCQVPTAGCAKATMGDSAASQLRVSLFRQWIEKLGRVPSKCNHGHAHRTPGMPIRWYASTYKCSIVLDSHSHSHSHSHSCDKEGIWPPRDRVRKTRFSNGMANKRSKLSIEKNHKSGSSILFFRDLDSHLCQIIMKMAIWGDVKCWNLFMALKYMGGWDLKFGRGHFENCTQN